MPPGYATAVWPPSGIALAAVLLWGPRVWPGIAAGSVLVNLGGRRHHGRRRRSLRSASSSRVSIAVGSTVQALVCAGAIRRWVGVSQVFETGPATLMFTGHRRGRLPHRLDLGRRDAERRGRRPQPDQFLDSWQTWWLGDLIGILVFAPVFLTWRQSLQVGRKPWRLGELVAAFAAARR